MADQDAYWSGGRAVSPDTEEYWVGGHVHPPTKPAPPVAKKPVGSVVPLMRGMGLI